MATTKPDQPVPLARTQSSVADVQALLFDTYGTVVDWRAGVIEALVVLGRSRALTVDWDAFLSDWKTRPIMDRVNRGELPWMTMETIHRQALAEPLANYGISPLTDREIDNLVQARWRLKPWPDAVPGLTRLKQRYVISPLSNASFIGMVKLAKFAGLPWDCVITAENARCYKPHPEAYRTALSLLGLRTAQVMLVAAHNYDLRAAQAEGLRTAFVPRLTEYGPAQTTDLMPEGDWDVIAKDFLDLATLLGA
jgi:2-haloacid dehalogenase